MHKDKQFWTCSSVGEQLSSTQEALGLIPSSTKQPNINKESVWVFRSIFELTPVLGKMHAFSIRFREYH